MEKLKAKWNAMKPWQRYGIVALVGLIIGAILGSLGQPPVAS